MEKIIIKLRGSTGTWDLDSLVLLSGSCWERAGHRVNKLTVTKMVGLQQQTQALQGVDIVLDLSSWTEVRGSIQHSSKTITIRGQGQVGILLSTDYDNKQGQQLIKLTFTTLWSTLTSSAWGCTTIWSTIFRLDS